MESVTTEQIAEMQKKNRDAKDEEFWLINVLPEEHYRERHIAGSTNIPADQADFVSRVEELIGDKDQPVIVYCASTSCDMSAKAAAKLEKAGFTSVHEYEGGTKAWQDAGLPVEGEKVTA